VSDAGAIAVLAWTWLPIVLPLVLTPLSIPIRAWVSASFARRMGGFAIAFVPGLAAEWVTTLLKPLGRTETYWPLSLAWMALVYAAATGLVWFKRERLVDWVVRGASNVGGPEMVGVTDIAAGARAGAVGLTCWLALQPATYLLLRFVW